MKACLQVADQLKTLPAESLAAEGVADLFARRHLLAAAPITDHDEGNAEGATNRIAHLIFIQIGDGIPLVITEITKFTAFTTGIYRTVGKSIGQEILAACIAAAQWLHPRSDKFIVAGSSCRLSRRFEKDSL